MSASNLPPDQRQAPLSLWRRVHGFMCELFSLFGEPQELAAKHTLSFKDYKLLLPWLRAGEALLRRLLLIEAALLEPQAPSLGPPASSPAVSKQLHTSQQIELDPENPDFWRVSFRISVAERRLPAGIRCFNLHGPEQAGAPNAGWKPALRYGGLETPRFRAAMPLARRFEALLRVYNDPAPFARRLAARLRKAASCVKRMLKDAWHTSRDLIGRDLYDAVIAPIEEAQRVLADSS